MSILYLFAVRNLRTDKCSAKWSLFHNFSGCDSSTKGDFFYLSEVSSFQNIFPSCKRRKPKIFENFPQSAIKTLFLAQRMSFIPIMPFLWMFLAPFSTGSYLDFKTPKSFERFFTPSKGKPQRIFHQVEKAGRGFSF